MSYQGKLLFSKLLSGYWPNVGIVSSRAEKIVEAIRRELDYTPYLAKSLQKAPAGRPQTQGAGRSKAFIREKSPAKKRSPSPKVIEDANKIAMEKMGKVEEEEPEQEEQKEEPTEIEPEKEEEWKKGEAKNDNIAMFDPQAEPTPEP